LSLLWVVAIERAGGPHTEQRNGTHLLLLYRFAATCRGAVAKGRLLYIPMREFTYRSHLPCVICIPEYIKNKTQISGKKFALNFVQCEAVCFLPVVSLQNTPTLFSFNPLKAELNPICHLLALLAAHLIFHISRIRVNATPSVLAILSVLVFHVRKFTLTSFFGSFTIFGKIDY
jgi:hypothetical protein